MLTKFYVRMSTAFVSDEGATAVEYGIMVALIAVIIIGAVTAIGTRLDGVFGTVRDALPVGGG